MCLAETFLAEFDDEMAVTRKFLELVPDDKLAWQPHPKSMLLGYLAWHLAGMPEWCLETLQKDGLKMTEEDGIKAAQERMGKKRADMLAKFDQDLTKARAALAKASDADLARHWTMEWGGQVVIDSPRSQVLRKWVMNHLVHHRAQLGVYFRLNGIAVPGAYGPSADEMGA